MPDELIRVIVSPDARAANLTLVGDWFSAESLSPKAGEGHRQTVFSWHAPTVLQALRRFDAEFEALAAENPHAPSRQAALAQIDALLADQPAHA